MNDTKTLTWIAEHLTKYTLGPYRAEMEYINDKGYTHTIKMESTEGLSGIEILRGLVATAIKAEKDESVQH